jgi:hypothetical protein
MHQAAAIVTFLSPGLRFFHQGQFEGRRTRISPHLVRAPVERTDDAVNRFYEQLLSVLRETTVRDGEWRLVECTPAWEGNWTWEGFLAFAWQRDDERLLVAVNYAGNQGQCYVQLPAAYVAGGGVRFNDLMSGDRYERAGSDLASKGLYVDLPPWGYHVFAVDALAPTKEVEPAVRRDRERAVR